MNVTSTHLLTAFSVLLVVGCGNKISNACATAVVTARSQSSLAGAALPGGYIRFGSKLCSATFEFSSRSDGGYEGIAWTAKHCTPDLVGWASGEKVSIQPYVSAPVVGVPGYLPEIPVRQEFVERRNVLLAEAAALKAKADPASRAAGEALEELGSHFGAPQKLSLCAAQKPSRPELSKELDKRFPQSEFDATCWSTSDLGFYPFVVESASVTDLNREDFQKFTATRLSVLKSAVPQPVVEMRGQKVEKSLDRHRANLMLLHAKGRLLAAAPLFDRLRWCKSGVALVRQATLPAAYAEKSEEYGAICPLSKKVESVAKAFLVETLPAEMGRLSRSVTFESWMKELGTDPLRPLTRADVLDKEDLTRSESLSSKSSGAILGLLNSTNDLVKALIADNPTANQNLAILANTALAVQGDPKKTTDLRFEKVRLTSDGASNEDAVVAYTVGYGFPLYLRKSKSISLGATDSGTLLTWQGLFPLVGLNGVNEDATSGGASLVALPERRRKVDAASANRTGQESTRQDQRSNSENAPAPREGADRETVNCG
ncbi:MAG: hypothetical protein IOD12_08770 [Silvanigrellales bacterium]|nr:hypothetical protein [Silvanigrellales bacterium]